MIRLLRNEKGMALISIYLLVAVMVTIMAAFFWTAYTEVRAAETIQNVTQAFYLAEAGIDQMIYGLNEGSQGTINGSTGEGTFQSQYNPSQGTITSTGTTLSGQTRTLYANVIQQVTFVPRGAFCAGEGFGSGLFSRFVFDGRDHNADGDLTGSEGEFGVSVREGEVFFPGPFTKIGGHGHAPVGFWSYSEGIDYELDAQWAEPITPESVLGLQPGDLDEYETATKPDPNFNGIYYLHNPQWDFVDFGDDPGSSGILIIENDSWWSSFLGAYTGNFNGILITDTFLSVTANLQVIGTAYATGPFLGLWGADSNFLYSDQVVEDMLLDHLGGKAVRYVVTKWTDENVGAQE